MIFFSLVVDETTECTRWPEQAPAKASPFSGSRRMVSAQLHRRSPNISQIEHGVLDRSSGLNLSSARQSRQHERLCWNSLARRSEAECRGPAPRSVPCLALDTQSPHAVPSTPRHPFVVLQVAELHPHWCQVIRPHDYEGPHRVVQRCSRLLRQPRGTSNTTQHGHSMR